jgi:hypothetical protein
MSESYEVIDNFLPLETADMIENILLSAEFPWYYNDCKSGEIVNKLYDFQFTHTFYSGYTPTTNWYKTVIEPFEIIIKPQAWLSIKANLNPKTEEMIQFGWHVDYDNAYHKTAVYYVNTNDGKTILKDGTEISSIKNRLLVFNNNILHTGTSTTDVKARAVLNFNFIP